jgi:uncharacterized protein with FMN-binding domain
VLTYSGADVPALASNAGAGGGAGLGASAGLGAPPADPTTAASPDAGSAPASAAASPTAAAATSPAAAPTAAAAPTKAAVATPAATKAAVPTPAATKPAVAPTPVVKPTPTPTPKPTNTGPKDYIGSLQTHKYGQVQVGIRVQNGKITKAWAAVYPNGPSQPYSDFSIPVLVSETVAKQSTSIANVSGATLTWQSWKTSLQSAMSKAGL